MKKIILFFFVIHAALCLAEPTPSYSNWQAGQILVNEKTHSRYKLDQVIGSGGLKTVWRAYEINAQNVPMRKVAISEFDKRFVDQPNLTRGEMLHSNEIVIDIGKKNALSRRFNISETGELNIEGTTTRGVSSTIATEADHDGIVVYNQMKILKNDPAHVMLAKLDAIADFTDSVSDMLSLLREHGYAHTDLKYSNLLVTSGVLQLADFDNVTKIGSEPKTATFDYAPPELISRDVVSRFTDEYSNGIMMYEAIFGSHPIDDYFNHLKSLPTDQVPRDLRRFLSKIITEDPNKATSVVLGAASEVAAEKLSGNNRAGFIMNSYFFERDNYQKFVKHNVETKVNELAAKMSVLSSDQRMEGKLLLATMSQNLLARLELDPEKRNVPGSMIDKVEREFLVSKVNAICSMHK